MHIIKKSLRIQIWTDILYADIMDVRLFLSKNVLKLNVKKKNNFLAVYINIQIIVFLGSKANYHNLVNKFIIK